MAKIALATEENINYKKRFLGTEFATHSTVDAISHATCGMAIDIGAKAIVVCSLSGMTARMISRFRSPVDILGITTSEHTWRQAGAFVGRRADDERGVQVHRRAVLRRYPAGAREARPQAGDKIVITGGVPSGQSGNTNLIKVEVI